MPKIRMIKGPSGLLPFDQEAAEWFDKVKIGQAVDAEFKLPRNAKFHRRFFAMLNVAFSNYDWPEVETKWGKAKCNFELFRKYVTVKAGHYEAALTPTGEVRAEPKSISWANMDEEQFRKLYSDVLDVILLEFLDNWTDSDMERAIEQMMSFAG